MTMRLLAFLILLVRIPSPVWTLLSTHLSVASRFNVGNRLVSPQGHFELRIFQISDQKYHLCIRYRGPILKQVVTWVANRDTPLSINSYLELSSTDGNLRLFDNSSRSPLWISSNTSNAGVERAQLLDSGNLVLVDRAGTIKWESFRDSSTTDTLLPGQHLYRNNSLTSWLTSENPSTRGNGSTYTFGWGIRGNLQLAWTPPLKPGVLTNWTDGRYVPAPDHVENNISNVDFVYLDTAHGHLYFPSFPADTVLLSGGDALSNTTLKRLTLDRDGGLRIWQWTEGTSNTWAAVANWVVNDQDSQCFAFGTCGPFGFCNMTPRDSLDRASCTCLPEIRHPSDPIDSTCDSFPEGYFCGSQLDFNMTELNEVDIRWGVGYRHFSTDGAGCREECMKDCNCTGAVHSRAEAKCWMRTGDLYNIGYPNANRTAYVKVPFYETPPKSGSTGGMSAALAAVVVILFILLGIWCGVHKSRHLRDKVRSYLRKRDEAEDLVLSGDESEHPGPVRGSPRTPVTATWVLPDTDFSTGDYVELLSAALDECDRQREELESLLPSVSIFKLLCHYSVETLSPAAKMSFEQCRNILAKPRPNGEIPSDVWSSSVRFCLESLAGLSQRFQLLVDLLRKCTSHEWYKSALELADVRPPEGVKRWSQFFLEVQTCEWSLDLAELAFHALQTLLTEGRTYPVSFHWVEARGRMVLERRVYNSVLLMHCGELEKKDVKALTQKLKMLEASERRKKRFYRGFSTAHEIARFLATKLEGPTPKTGTYLPYSFWKIDPANMRSGGQYLNVETLHSAGNDVVKDKWNTIKVAVKTVLKCDRVVFETEAAILGMVQHPNVVRLIGCGFIEKFSTGLLVMELMDGDLRKLIDSRLQALPPGSCPFSPSVAIDIMLQIAQAMLYLRNHDVLHRDLKAKNILVNKLSSSSDHEHCFVVKLADFGLAKHQPRTSDVATLNAGTTRWRAPEVFNKRDDALVQHYKWPADVYSYGMTCYEVLTGKIPFQDEPTSNGGLDLQARIEQGVRPSLENLSVEVPEALKDLIRWCWETDPDARPQSFDVIVKGLWECKVQSTLPSFLQTQV